MVKIKINLTLVVNTYLKGFHAINSCSGIVNAVALTSLRFHTIHVCSLMLGLCTWHVKPLHRIPVPTLF
jgi:hypothetical protein